jgi:hypothetical protein
MTDTQCCAGRIFHTAVGNAYAACPNHPRTGGAVTGQVRPSWLQPNRESRIWQSFVNHFMA